MSKYNISNYLCEVIHPNEVVPEVPSCTMEFDDAIGSVDPPCEKITITADQVGEIICAYRTAANYAADKLYEYGHFKNLHEKYKEACEDIDDAFHRHMYEEFTKDMNACLDIYNAQKEIAEELRSYLFVIGIHV